MYPFALAANDVFRLETNRLVGTTSWRALNTGFDDYAGGAALFETTKHLQQEYMPQAMPVKPWMNTDWLDLSDPARGFIPPHTEAGQGAIG